MNLIPTILEETQEGFIYQFKRLVPYFHSFQIDIADEEFAGHHTLGIKDIEKAFDHISPQLLHEATLDLHLMTKKYEDIIDCCRALNTKIPIKNILIHHSLSPDYSELARRFPQYTLGGVLNSEDDVSRLPEDSPLFSLPLIQLMTVQIGAQGNPFIPQVLRKIEQLKNKGFRGKIYLDGGVNKDSLPLIASQVHLPDLLCVGSFLTHSQQLPEDTEYLFDFLRDKQTKK